MGDEDTKAPVTDSRFPGFNPEVEASKAAAEKAAAEAAAKAAGSEPDTPPPPKYTHRCGACGAMFEELVKPCAACGAADNITELPS